METVKNNNVAAPVRSTHFERFAGACAVLTSVAGFLYAVASIVLQNALLSGLFLMLVGLLSSATLVAVYERLRETNATFALFALILGVAGALGSAVHEGYDLANAINPPLYIAADLPNPVDPRGLLTFGVSGLALFVFAALILRGEQFPRGLGYLGYLSAALLVALPDPPRPDEPIDRGARPAKRLPGQPRPVRLAGPGIPAWAECTGG